MHEIGSVSGFDLLTDRAERMSQHVKGYKCAALVMSVSRTSFHVIQVELVTSTHRPDRQDTQGSWFPQAFRVITMNCKPPVLPLAFQQRAA